MDREKAKILADAIFEIAKKYDDCGDPKCDLVHATVCVMLNKEWFKEAIELAKKNGLK
jgi:hypothetical protein